MRNENNHLKELLLNRRVVRNYLETNEEFPNLSDIPKLTIKIPTAGFSRGIEIVSVENKENILVYELYFFKNLNLENNDDICEMLYKK